MSDPQSRPLVLWGLSDGRAGHLAQARGLMRALADRRPCRCFELAVPSLFASLTDLALGRARFADRFPAPDIIIGAGHATHLPLLGARRARGGRTVALMRPTLPPGCFDACIIPEHDAPPAAGNILLSHGPLNSIAPADGPRAREGLILVGGPSRHYRWDEAGLLEQIKAVLDDASRCWVVTDSPRTPASTSTALARQPGAEYRSWRDCPDGWLQQRLGECETAWVSEDSMSMVYEALTGSAAVGLLEVPRKRDSRLVRAVTALAEQGHVTRFRDWRGGPLPLPRRRFNEAARCAGLLIDRLGL